MAAGTLVSRLTGFARAAIIAAALGLGVTADVFNVPNVIPNMIYILVGGGVLNSVLVPVLVRAIKSDADGGEAYSQRLFSLTVTVLALATVLSVLLAPALIRLIVDDQYLAPEMRPFYDNMVMFARFCLPQIFFYGLYVLIGQILNAKGRFGPMMWAPILNNIIAIGIFAVYLLVFGTKSAEAFDTSEVILLGLGSTLGVAAQAIILIPVLQQTGFSLRFRSDWRGQGLGDPVRLGVWSIGFVVVNQIAYLFVVNVATGATAAAGEGGAGYTVYANAMLIMLVPHAIVTVSLATALLPGLSSLASEGEMLQLRTQLASAVRTCLTIIVPLAAVLAVLAQPIAAAIFGYGSAQGQTAAVGNTLVALLPGLLAYTVHYLSMRGFYAVQDLRTPFFNQVWIAGVMVAWAIGLSILSPDPGIVTTLLAVGYSVSYIVGATLSVVRLQHSVGYVDLGLIAQQLARLILPTVVAALLAWLMWTGWETLGLHELPVIGRFAGLAIAAAVGCAAFVGLAYVIGISEARHAVELVLARIQGRTPAPHEPQLEDTVEHPGPLAETSTFRALRAPTVDPTATMEFVLDDTMHGMPSILAEDPAPGHGAAAAGPATPSIATLAGRYNLEDLIDSTAGVSTWRGFDRSLQRPVFVQTLPNNDHRATAFLTAAQRASAATDHRFLRVLDIGAEQVTYVIWEWTMEAALDRIVAGQPLEPGQAAAIARDVAHAISSAHSQGLYHQRLRPEDISVSSDGTIRIAGLETSAVLYGSLLATNGAPQHPVDPVLQDVVGLGGLLYTGLTRLPCGPQQPLAQHVNPQVPQNLSVLADRATGHAARHQMAPVQSAAEFARELEAEHGYPYIPAPMSQGFGGAPGPDDGISFFAGAEPDPITHSRRERRAGRRRTRRAFGAVTGLLLLAVATVAGVQFALGGLDGLGDSTSTRDSSEQTDTSTEDAPETSAPDDETPSQEPSPVDLAGADYFDPFGSQPENPEQTGLAIDGDPETAWSTLEYYDPLELQKAGVGLYVDLGSPQVVAGLEAGMLHSGADVEVRVAPESADSAPSDITGWDRVLRERPAGDTLRGDLDDPVTTRYVLIWFTKLPAVDGNFRGGVTDVTILGLPAP